jgi:hypothetical protein
VLLAIVHDSIQNKQESIPQALSREIRWRSLPEGVKPLRLVWNYTDIPPEFTQPYLQMLAAPRTVMMLSLSMLEMYHKVSLLPTSLIDDERVEQIPTSGSRELSLNELVDQVVNEERTRSALLLPFGQSLNALSAVRGDRAKEHAESRSPVASMLNCS